MRRLHLKPSGQRNLRKVYNEATAAEVEHGQMYYIRMHERLQVIGEQWSQPVSAVAGAFAVLSPNITEGNNFEDLYRSLEAAELRSGEDSYRTSAFHKNRRKAYRILTGTPASEVVSGRKVTSFYHNMRDPGNKDWVTVDMHILSCHQNERMSLYHLSENQYRVVAERVTDLAYSENLIPCELQAILWHVWKRMHGIVYTPQLPLYTVEDLHQSGIRIY